MTSRLNTEGGLTVRRVPKSWPLAPSSESELTRSSEPFARRRSYSSSSSARARYPCCEATSRGVDPFYISWRTSNEYSLLGAVHKVRHARGGGGPRSCDSL